MTITNVSVNVDEIPSPPWPLDASAIARVDFAPLSRALAAVVLDRFGAVLSYPDPDAGTTRVRFEWQLDRARPNWWRLGIILSGPPGAPPSSTGYVGLGDGQRRMSTEVAVRQRELAAIRREFARVLESTAERLGGEGMRRERPLFYVELPAPLCIEADATVPALRATIRRSAVLRPNQARIAAVGIDVDDSSPVTAREFAMRSMGEVAALMTLVGGAAVTAWRRYPIGFRHGDRMRASRISVYPGRFFREDTTKDRHDIGLRLAAIGTVVSRLTTANRELWTRMLLGYATATELVRFHPTVASVTYLAALSAGLRDEQCGRAVCPDHGTRLHHGVRGERRMIADRLIERDVVPASERAVLEKLLRRVYADQRSAFVHDAELAHTERSDTRLLALPTAEDIVTPQWHRRDDLARVASLTRALVFAELAAWTGTRLIAPALRVSVYDRTGLEGSVRAKANTRLAMKSVGGLPMYAVAERGVPLHLGLRDMIGARPSADAATPDATRS